MNNPEYARIKGKKYKINTDYKVALECNKVAMDSTIGDYERSLAIIYLLFGEEGLNSNEDYNELLELSIKFLKCNEEIDESSNETPDMDFEQDLGLIKASFKSDYGITLDEEYMHWWDFYMYLKGLTENCVLNRVRELRDYDLSTIKDQKEKKKMEKAKKRFALRTKEAPITEEQQRSVDNFYKLTGLKRKE